MKLKREVEGLDASSCLHREAEAASEETVGVLPW